MDEAASAVGALVRATKSILAVQYRQDCVKRETSAHRCELDSTHLWQEGYCGQLQGLEDVEQAAHDLRVVAGHGRIPQRTHQGVDGHRGVVLFTAGHQPRRVQQVPSQVVLWNSTYSRQLHSVSQ